MSKTINTDPVAAVPFGLNQGQSFGDAFMAHRVVGVVQAGGWIVFVALALGNVNKQDAVAQTPVPNYVVADFFSPDFLTHRRVAYCEVQPWGASLWHNGAGECAFDGQTVRLDTGRWLSPTQDDANLRILRTMPMWGRLFSITKAGITSTGPSPDPSTMVFSDARNYQFGDRVVRMDSSFKMVCRTVSGELCWVLRLHSYLYTPVQENDGIIYFGTAGAGGHCYGVDLGDGHVVVDVNTGGTEQFAWWRGRLVIAGRGGDLLIVDRHNGHLVGQMGLGGLTPHQYLPYLIVGDRLYTTAASQDASFAVMANLSRA